MFYTGEWLKCTGCSEQFSLPLGDIFLYTEGDLDLSSENVATSAAFHPVLRRRAWCAGCNQFVLVERLPSVTEFMNAAALIRGRSPDAPDIDDELLELSLTEQQFLLEKFLSRSASARCLLCGSTAWIGLDEDAGRLHPPLRHESCNSPLEWHGIIAGVNRRAGTVKVRAYSFDGKLVAEAMI